MTDAFRMKATRRPPRGAAESRKASAPRENPGPDVDPRLAIQNAALDELLGDATAALAPASTPPAPPAYAGHTWSDSEMPTQIFSLDGGLPFTLTPKPRVHRQTLPATPMASKAARLARQSAARQLATQQRATQPRIAGQRAERPGARSSLPAFLASHAPVAATLIPKRTSTRIGAVLALTGLVHLTVWAALGPGEENAERTATAQRPPPAFEPMPTPVAVAVPAIESESGPSEASDDEGRPAGDVTDDGAFADHERPPADDPSPLPDGADPAAPTDEALPSPRDATSSSPPRVTTEATARAPVRVRTPTRATRRAPARKRRRRASRDFDFGI